MNHVIQEVHARFYYTIQEKNAQILVDNDLPKSIGYMPWVEEVMANYVSNALKYGGHPPTIQIGAETLPDGFIRYWVKDNGQGLSKEEQEKLFTPFTRLNQNIARGHGLGLSIVQRIVSKLGGTVGVHSTVGRGCEFFFTLPAISNTKSHTLPKTATGPLKSLNFADEETSFKRMPIHSATINRRQTGELQSFNGVHTRFVGRQSSLKSMLALSRNLEKGIGGIIWIEGEAGIGKTRLIRKFQDLLSLPTAPFIWSGRCRAQRSDHAFSLITNTLANIFNIQATDSDEQVRHKMEVEMQDWARDARETRPYLELMMGLPPSGAEGEALQTIQPEKLHQQSFVAMRRLLKTMVKQRPIVFLLDDLHWIDPISAEMLLFIATMVVSEPILFVCAQRLQGADSPNDRLVRLQSLLPGQTSRIFVDKFSDANNGQLLDQLLPTSDLPEAFRELTIDRSNGNPYFIEEFVRSFIEQGYLKQVNDRWQIDIPVVQFEDVIPLSIDKLIQTRIEALPVELKQVTQIAAIMGPQFEANLLATLLPTVNVQQTLTRLKMRLIVSETAVSDRWQFNHLLFHTVLYSAMSATVRQSLHLQVAVQMEEQWADPTSERTKELAYHFTQAGQPLQALPYHILMGEYALRQYANEEAINQLQEAQESLSLLAEPNHQWEWRIAIGLGEAYRIIGKYDDAIAILQSVLPLAQTNPLFNGRYPMLLRRLGETYRKQGDYEKAHQHLTEAKGLLDETTTTEQAKENAHIHTELAWVHFSQGEFDLAGQICHQSLALASQAGSQNEMAKAENLLGGINYQIGDGKAALAHTIHAMSFYEEMGLTWDVANTTSNLGILAHIFGDWPQAILYFQRSLDLRKEMGDVEGVAITHNNLGGAYRGQGEFSMAEYHYRESIDSGHLFDMPYIVANACSGLAQVLLPQGHLFDAATMIQEGISQAEAIGAQDVLAEMYRVQAEFYLEKNELELAAEKTEASAKLAAEIGNKVYEAAAWRVAAEVARRMNQLHKAQQNLVKAQDVLTEATNELEKGQIYAQSYRVYLDMGESEKASANFYYSAAYDIFSRLGANYYLHQLKNLTPATG